MHGFSFPASISPEAQQGKRVSGEYGILQPITVILAASLLMEADPIDFYGGNRLLSDCPVQEEIDMGAFPRQVKALLLRKPVGIAEQVSHRIMADDPESIFPVSLFRDDILKHRVHQVLRIVFGYLPMLGKESDPRGGGLRIEHIEYRADA